MSAKKRLVILGLVLLIVAVALSLFASRQSIQERLFKKVTINLQNPWLHDNSVYFYTNSFFAKYDTKTNSIDRLSDYLLIKNGVSSVSWAPGSVVFRTNADKNDRDDVTTAAQQLGVKPYAPHWWKYDFQAKQYQLLDFAGADQCANLVQLDKEQLACVLAQPSGGKLNKLLLLNIATKSSKTLLDSDDAISNFALSDGNLLYIVSRLDGKQSLGSINLASGKATVPYKGKGQLVYYTYADGKVLVIDTTAQGKAKGAEDSHGSDAGPASVEQGVVLLNGNDTVLKKDIKLPPVTPYSDGSGKALFSSLDGSINSVDADGIHEVAGPATPSLKTGGFLFQANQKFYTLSSVGDLSSSPATSRGADSRYPSSFNLKRDNAASGNSFIDPASNDEWDVYMYLPDVSSSQQQLAVGTMLEQKGFKPSEFDFNWIPDGVDFHIPIEPNAIVIR